MTRTDRITDLLAVTARLIACMEREIALLRAMRPQDMQMLHADKIALAEAYEAHYLALRESRDGDEGIGEALRGELLEATDRLQTVLADNARALRVVKEANDRVLKSIVDAVAQKQARSAGYTGTGAQPGARQGTAPRLSLTLDQRL